MNTDTYTPIKDLKIGHYEQTFLVSQVTFNDAMVTASATPFAKIVVKDITGELEGVAWDVDNFVFIAGHYYHMAVDVKTYKGKLNLSINANNITEVGVPLNVHDYVQHVSDATLREHSFLVQSVFESITDEHYKNVIGNAIQRLDLMNALKTSPYGLTGPLAYKGGLLVHVAGALKIANLMIREAIESETPINLSLVLASCMLRNIGWHTTTTSDLRARDAFYMTGINRASARYVDHLMIHTESDLGITIPETKKQALENSCNEVACIKTIEGRIAAAADDMIDLLYFGGDALRQKSNGNWTNEIFTGHNK